MHFNQEHFIHPGRADERMEFEARLKRRFGFEITACYQAAGLATPFLADHAACARVLTKASNLLEEIEEGCHCLIETAEDFLDELKHRV